MCALDYIENCYLRSNSQIAFDVQCKEESFLADEVLEEFLTFIKKKMKFSIIHWEPSRKEYPNYMFLSGDKGILAYVDIKYVESDEPF